MTVAFTVAATDVADALTIAWDSFRSAARDDTVGREVAALGVGAWVVRLLPAGQEFVADRRE